MIFGRKLPAPVARLGGHPIDFALLDDGAWIVPFADRLVYAPAEAMPDEQGGAGATEEPGYLHEWFDFEGESWNEGARTITFAFVDRRARVDDHLRRGGEAENLVGDSRAPRPFDLLPRAR